MADIIEHPDHGRARHAVLELTSLRNSGIFDLKNGGYEFFIPCVTFALITIADLLKFLNKCNNRITKNEFIPNDCEDITDFIINVRNAACHIRSDKREAVQSVITNAVIDAYGQGGLQINDLVLKSEFVDDIAVFWGATRLYIFRNLFSAFDDCREIITPDLIGNEVMIGKKRTF